jgi:dipeptidyl aminopeptidase/acylaminoacyl peptidase
MPEPTPMTPDTILRQVVLEEHDLAADGRSAVVVKRHVREGRYVSTVQVVDLTAGHGRPRDLTDGTTHDGKPRIRPDGRTVAVVRSDPADPDRSAWICLLPLDGGDATELRRAGHGAVGEIAWSPDGRRLAFTGEVDPPRFLVGDVPAVDAPPTDPGRERGDTTPLARHITRIDWRWDGVGHVDRWSHLFVVDVGPRRGPGRARQVTRGDWGVSGITWRPDGRTVAFVADRGPDADVRPRPTIHAVDVDAAGAEPVEVLSLGGPAAHPAYSPDGRWLAAVGVVEPDPLDDVSPGLVVGPADGSATPVALAPDLDRPIGQWADTDLTGWMVDGRPGPVWLDDRNLLAVVTDQGRSYPMRFEFDPDSGRPGAAPVPGPWSDVVVPSMAVANGTVSVLGTLGARGLELMTLERDVDGGGRWRTHTRHGTAWQRRHAIPEMRCVLAPGPGGPIETWIASPPDAGDAALPTIVDVHGGPLGAWAPTPNVETMLLTAHGYRVVLPNIRGSASYGRDWIRPQLGDWGGVDAEDVHAALDHVIGLGLADPDRLGALGLSYGGFMVHWLIGTSDRFRAAVSENGVVNQVSAWANSDSGPEYDRTSLLGDVFSPEGVERLWRQSPLAHVSAMRTPLLMLQAEADRRCPPGDNEQLFVALRLLGRTVEYVLYPEEFHVFSSSGRPDRRVDRMTRMLDWFDRFLG